MAVTLNAVGPSATSASGTSVSSLTWSHTVGSGSNRVLYANVRVGFNAADSTRAKSSCTYNGVTMKSVGKVLCNNDVWGFVEVFRMINPPSGAHNVVATCTKSAAVLIGDSIDYFNADQTTPNGPIGTTAASAGTTATTDPIATKSTGIVHAVAGGGSGFSATTGTLEASKNVNTATGSGNAMTAIYAGGSPVTPHFTLTSDFWGIVAFHVNAVGDLVAVPVTVSTPLAAQNSFASNFAASGSPYAWPTISVPDGAVLGIVSVVDSSPVSAVVTADADSHTWSRLTATFNSSTNPFAYDYWYNNTGAAVDVAVQTTFTYSNNRTVGLIPRLVIGSDGTPVIRATATGGSQTPQLSAVPGLLGSLMEFDFVQQGQGSPPSSFVSGSTATNAVDYSSGGSGSDAMSVGSIRQSAVNAQTATSQAVGAGAPTSATYGALVEYKPPTVAATPTPRATLVVARTALIRASSW